MGTNQPAWSSATNGRSPIVASESRNAGLIHESVYRHLRSLILSGALAQGARFGSSRKLASDLQISRNSVLTALDRLIADGWLEARDRSGVYVTYSGPRVTSPTQVGSWDKAGDQTPFAWGWATDVFPVQ